MLPVIGPILGLDLSPELIRQLGDQTVQVAQALAGLLGTAMAIYGRTRATLPLARRSMVIQL